MDLDQIVTAVFFFLPLQNFPIPFPPGAAGHGLLIDEVQARENPGVKGTDKES